MRIPPARVPLLDHRLTPMAHALAAELLAEISGRDSFQTATHADLPDAAETFARYRLSPLWALFVTLIGMPAACSSLIRGTWPPFSPPKCSWPCRCWGISIPVSKSKANANDPLFEELVIPERLRNFRDDLSPMGAFFKPDQLMANYVSRELARGKCQTPPYTPYIAAGISTAPWPVPSDEHTASTAKWTNNKQAPKPGARPPPFHAWALYRLRFFITADLCAAWPPFGGLADQLNNLSILLRLAAVESIDVAPEYDAILPAHLEELVRARSNRTAGAVYFTDLLSTEQHRFKILAIDRAAKSAPPPAGRYKAAEKATGEAHAAAAPNRKRVPRNMYHAQLADGGKAAEAAAMAAATASSSSDAPPPLLGRITTTAGVVVRALAPIVVLTMALVPPDRTSVTSVAVNSPIPFWWFLKLQRYFNPVWRQFLALYGTNCRF